jgi:flavin reductase (DIM6/NTAB) family NADH-FMN oxidoreductase RutF
MFDAAIDGGGEGTMTVTMEPAFDVRSFRRALGHFPTGVCVVTSQVDGVRVGMTVSSFNSLSLEPPLILFGIDGRTTGLSLWRKAKGYAVNMLAENQKDLSDRFAKSGSNKWEGTTYADGLFGSPLLPGTAAVLECGAWATHAGGDHLLFIAEVKRFRTFADRRPLVFSKGRYAKLHETEFAASLWPLDIHY